MLIHVIFQNQSHGYLGASCFDELLATFPIASFRRNDGWVRVGLDPIRSMAADSPPRSKNEERRKSCRALKKIGTKRTSWKSWTRQGTFRSIEGKEWKGLLLKCQRVQFLCTFGDFSQNLHHRCGSYKHLRILVIVVDVVYYWSY